eukprot:4205063-Alexandrium_andersonii.AAC.1
MNNHFTNGAVPGSGPLRQASVPTHRCEGIVTLGTRVIRRRLCTVQNKQPLDGSALAAWG